MRQNAQLVVGNMFDYNQDYIYRVKNFISDSEAEYLLSYLQTFGNDLGDNAQKHIRFMEQLLDNKAEEILKKYEKNTYLEILGNYSRNINLRIERLGWMRRLELVKWNYNKSLEPHTDGHTQIPNEPGLSLSTLIYLNDDYIGGEICFPDYGISIKPDAKDLIIFPSHFLHEVKETKEMQNGRRRCTIPMFYTFDARRFEEYTHYSYIGQIEEFEKQQGEYFSEQQIERKV